MIIKSPSHPFGAGEALKLKDNVHITLKNNAFISGVATGYNADGGYLEYIMLADGKRRTLVYGKDIKEITVLPMEEAKEKRR